MLCQHPWGGKQLWQPLLQCLTLSLYKKGFRSTISWILKKYWLENALANSKHNHSAFVDLGRLLQNLCMYPVLHSSNFHQTYKEKSTRKYHMNNVLENDGLWNNHMIQVGYVFYVTIPTPMSTSGVTLHNSRYVQCQSQNNQAHLLPYFTGNCWDLVLLCWVQKKKLLHIDFISDIWLVICILGIFFTPSPSYVAGGKYIVSDFPAKPFAAAACTMYHLNINWRI